MSRHLVPRRRALCTGARLGRMGEYDERRIPQMRNEAVSLLKFKISLNICGRGGHFSQRC